MEQAVRFERGPEVAERPVPRDVEDQIVAKTALGEIFSRVVDDLVGPERTEHAQLARHIYRGDVRAVGLGDLQSERSDASLSFSSARSKRAVSSALCFMRDS